jgi:WD repeat-containing protein 19
MYLGDAASSVEFLKDKEYLGTVQDMHLNGDYCAVRFDGKILLHVLEGKDTIKIRLTCMFHHNIKILDT